MAKIVSDDGRPNYMTSFLIVCQNEHFKINCRGWKKVNLSNISVLTLFLFMNDNVKF